VKEQQRAAKVLQILRENLALPNWVKGNRDPFETLVVTIISQNTADTNTARAFEALSKRFEITPEALAKGPLCQIEEAIRTAGLYKSKAKTLQQAAATVHNKYGGSLKSILELPLEDARAALMEFPGVGPKTADVVLLFSAKQPTIPVDTHVNRVSKRLGFAPMNGDYEKIRGSLQQLFEPEDFLAVHLLLIEHGRKTCKARRPRCTACPVNTYCPTCGQWG
jgi:endonuclease III